MDKIVIRGGRPLKGEVVVSGAKNAALPVLISALLTDRECRYLNVPQLVDTQTTLGLLTEMGSTIVADKEGIAIQIAELSSPVAPYDLVRRMRASILVLGPLVARVGRAKVSLPGGCAIGARPVNLHINALRKMGAQVDIEDGYIVASAKRLQGAKIYFDTVTVTGTENIMMAATLAQGTTELQNAAREPEVVSLAETLIAMGAKIQGAGTSTIVVEGVGRLEGTTATIMSDRIEAGTLMIAAAITNGDVVVKNCNPEHLLSLSELLQQAGCVLEKMDNAIRVQGVTRPEALDIVTSPYPGFATDLQAQMMAFMSLAKGTTLIAETVFENRFMHVGELCRMGANIKIDGHTAKIVGVKSLQGAPVMATDLRASASLVLAGLRATGKTEISRIYHLDRGYEAMEKKFALLGADIRRVKG
ncbi:MAG: UDP-N-acetylglucosamine 1-carboxyvinyltransferase [Deltaproteobacteria bacterium]|nr:UDP-N-acetylglucosamine 1-carboxyvinyltransferase [Deltaproteobacteria bacterium]